MQNLVKLIAEAIKSADNSYLFENYTKQAKAVIKELDKNGYIFVPKDPTEEMIKAGVFAINLGLVDAKKLAKKIYQEMLDADQ